MKFTEIIQARIADAEIKTESGKVWTMFEGCWHLFTPEIIDQKIRDIADEVNRLRIEQPTLHKVYGPDYLAEMIAWGKLKTRIAQA